jgi:hypothetical protein
MASKRSFEMLRFAVDYLDGVDGHLILEERAYSIGGGLAGGPAKPRPGG